MSKYKWFALFVAIAMLLAACQPAAPTEAPAAPAEPTEAPAAPAEPTEAPPEPTEAPPPAEPKTATISFFEEPDTLNRVYTSMWFAQLAIDLMQLGFWQIDDAKEVNLELAAEVPTIENGGISEDGLTITIPLREGVVWTDGTPVTAHDYIFTYEMIMADGNAVQSRYPFDTYVESVTALDDYTVQFVMNAPFVGWAAGFDVAFLPKHILEPVFAADGTIDNADWNRDQSVTNGPFKLKEWEAASHLILEANDDYWRGRPVLDQIFIRIVPDEGAQMAAIKAGDVDIGVYLTAADKPDIDEMSDVELLLVAGGWVESWFFNLISEELAAENELQAGHVALQDKLVRRAIVMGFDRSELNDSLFYGLYRIPATFYYDSPFEDTSIEPWPYDPEGAMALLDEAGWTDTNGDGTRDKDGVELVIQYSTTAGNELRESTGLVFQQSMAEIGIGVEILNYSYDVMWNGYGDDGPAARGKYDIVEWSTAPDGLPDPDTVIWICAEIPSADYPAGSNWQGVCMEELDELFAQQSVTVDQEARIQLFYEIESIMHDEMFWMGVRTDDDFWALNNRMQNVIFSGVDSFWNSYEWDVAD